MLLPNKMMVNPSVQRFSSIIGCIIGVFALSPGLTECFQPKTIVVPSQYTAQSGDLHLKLYTWPELFDTPSKIQLQVTLLDDKSQRPHLELIDVHLDRRETSTNITVPCEYFPRGGFYALELLVGNSSNGSGSAITITELDNNNSDNNSDGNSLTKHLDVRWPQPKLTVTSESIGTYPQTPVDVIVEFPDVQCYTTAPDDAASQMPEFWLDLLYCGHDYSCDVQQQTTTSSGGNLSSSTQVLYAEQLRGFPKIKIISLRCELFGLAGNYAIKLRPTFTAPASLTARAFIKADWSEQFVFNVHARNIFPCDPHTGISVLFEYPACILDQADRIRLFAKQRADVASLAPPTSLHYVTEQRVLRGHHSMYFDCDMFSEKYVEYCFVYVSQSLSGAVADVRMDCVPTLQVSDVDVGGWGPWSDWTPCSTTCSGGTRNRYRICDSPPPRYGAKFCEGNAVETQHCGGSSLTNTWECLYSEESLSKGEMFANQPEIRAEIGLGCRCGCIVHLGVAKPKRLIASSAHSCPGRIFWLIQADDGSRINFKTDFIHLPCASQYLKIRDGDSLATELIGEYTGGSKKYPDSVTSSSSKMLLEFYSNEFSLFSDSCGGGFLAHAQQMYYTRNNDTVFVSSKSVMPVALSTNTVKLTIVHIAAILFASIIITISALLGAQYVCRYRKYQLAENLGELDSPAYTPQGSIGSHEAVEPLQTRAVSTSTLFSDVVSLVKLRTRTGRMKHSRLRESVEIEILEGEAPKAKSITSSKDGSYQTLILERCNSLGGKISETKISNETLRGDSQMAACSIAASVSLPPTPSDTPLPPRKQYRSDSAGAAVGFVKQSTAIIVSDQRPATAKSTRMPLGHVREEDDADDAEHELFDKHLSMRSVSNVTLTNGCYSPASSMIGTAIIRTNNIKESKEKQNRERLLAGPAGSEFSLANQEDLELDYYDYNVMNAGAVPGSYLGMDPAYLVWIPPLDGEQMPRDNCSDDDDLDGDKMYRADDSGSQSTTSGVLKTYDDPKSNTETPTDDDVAEYSAVHILQKQKHQENQNQKKAIIEKTSAVFNLHRNDVTTSTCGGGATDVARSTSNMIQMHELTTAGCSQLALAKMTRPGHYRDNRDLEEETAIGKQCRPEADKLNINRLDDIQFADDDDGMVDCGDSNRCSERQIAAKLHK